MQDIKIIKLPEVLEMTQLSQATIYRLMAQGKFPRQFKLSERSSGWLKQEVLEYLEDRLNDRHFSA